MKEDMIRCIDTLKLKMEHDMRLLEIVGRFLEHTPRCVTGYWERHRDNTYATIIETEDGYHARLSGEAQETLSEVKIRNRRRGRTSKVENRLATSILNDEWEVLLIGCAKDE